jgi:hypothetical protein
MGSDDANQNHLPRMWLVMRSAGLGDDYPFSLHVSREAAEDVVAKEARRDAATGRTRAETWIVPMRVEP